MWGWVGGTLCQPFLGINPRNAAFQRPRTPDPTPFPIKKNLKQKLKAHREIPGTGVL